MGGKLKHYHNEQFCYDYQNPKYWETTWVIVYCSPRVQACAVGQALLDAQYLECITASSPRIFNDEYAVYRPGQVSTLKYNSPTLLFIYHVLFVLWTQSHLSITQRGSVGWEACLGFLWMVTAKNRTSDPLIKATGWCLYKPCHLHPLLIGLQLLHIHVKAWILKEYHYGEKNILI